MVHAANTVTYNMANDDESFNKERASNSLEWHVKQSPKKKNRAVNFGQLGCEIPWIAYWLICSLKWEP
jgi:hypothetical protein